MECNVILLAAGKGTRMMSHKSNVSKVSMPLLGVPMVRWVIEATKPLHPETIVTVVGYGGDSIRPLVEGDAEIVVQEEQKGTADAVRCAKSILKDKKGVAIVVSGDRPLLRDKTLAALLSAHEANHDTMTILSALEGEVGKIVKENGRVLRITKTKNDPSAKDCKESNLGVYAFDNQELFKAIEALKPGVGGEYHLADLAEVFASEGKKVSSFVIADPLEANGVNDRLQLSNAIAVLQDRINRKLMLSGVTIEDPRTTYVGPNVRIEPDTVLRPNTHIYGDSEIGEGNSIGPGTYLENVKIGDNNVIEYCHLVDTIVEGNTTLGPYLRTRKNTILRNGVHIGNFNELKNVDFGEGSKCAHLSYLGDSTFGKEVNVGCGSIVANYDGVNKFRSDVGDHAFIGSGTILVSPVHVEDYGFTAAGSTITEDVPAHSMAIARARQVNKDGLADTFHEKALAKKSVKK